MKIYISHASSYDYENELYKPIQQSDLIVRHDFFLPHLPENKDKAAATILADAGLLVAEASYPSTGQGIELGLAHAAGVPIVCFYKEGTKPSGSLRFVCNDVITYKDTADFLKKLTDFLGDITSCVQLRMC